MWTMNWNRRYAISSLLNPKDRARLDELGSDCNKIPFSFDIKGSPCNCNDGACQHRRHLDFLRKKYLDPQKWEDPDHSVVSRALDEFQIGPEAYGRFQSPEFKYLMDYSPRNTVPALHRGITLWPGHNDDAIAGIKVGNVIRHDYGSWSSDPKVALDRVRHHSGYSTDPTIHTDSYYKDIQGRGQLPIVMHLPPGGRAIQISPFNGDEYFASENEWHGGNGIYRIKHIHEDPETPQIKHVYLEESLR